MKRLFETTKRLLINWTLLLLVSCFLLNGVQTGKFLDDSPVQKRVEVKQNLSKNAQIEEIIETEPVKEEINIINTINLPQQQVQPILNYYQNYFKSLARLDSFDTTSYFYQNDLNDQIATKFDQVYYDLTLSERENSLIDLTMKEYSINLDIAASDVLSPDEINVIVIEKQDIVYNGTSKIHSEIASLQNVFRLKNIDNNWKIVRHEKEDALYGIIRNQLEGIQIPDRIVALDEIKNKVELMFLKEDEAQLKAFEEEKKDKTPLRDNATYNRNAAINYAHKWFSIRNPEYYDYSDEGGNCNNFISQCLRAGGMPEDYNGAETWYYDVYYPTYSWLLVDSFYNYATNNKEGGLKTITTDNFFSGLEGDIIQLGVNDNWLHSVIITRLVKDDEGNTVDYLIDSNTSDNKTIPVSTYGYPQMRLIKIVGKN